ncbi:MAG: heterodisulfide reductase-related iron-sulfur binding cluster [Anaerolineae bacterium]
MDDGTALFRLMHIFSKTRFEIMDSVPFRDNFWNIPFWAQIFLYFTMAAAILAMLLGIYWRIQVWRRGQPATRFDHLSQRFARLIKYAVAQVKILSQRYPGVMHFGIFWGFVLLFIGTALATLDADVWEPLGGKLLIGPFYLLYELVLDLAGLFFVLALGLAIYRRYVLRPERLGSTRLFGGFTFTLTILLLINVTGLLVEGLRLAVAQPVWGMWSVVGWVIGQLFLVTGMDVPTLSSLHLSLWVLHFALVGMFIATLPYSTLFHLVTAPLNVFTSSFKPAGELATIEDIETAETLGVGQLSEFTWPQLLDFDACTECGRCQVVCPAHMAGTPLNPKRLILDLRDYMTGQAAVLLDSKNGKQEAGLQMVGDIIERDVLWSCTTCRACVHECPVLIEHVDTIVDMRRYLTLTLGDIPASAALSLQNLNRAGNPWGQPSTARDEWAKGLDVPLMADKGEADVLWWVGCAGSYDERSQKISRALVKIFGAAGVDYAILGQEETCNGDLARRLGDEYTFQVMAQQNIETLKQYKFRRIVTACPHCFSTLANEYPHFDGKWEVIHHSQFIQELIAAGRLRFSQTLDEVVAFHDSCYLGRYNGIYQPPRDVVAAIPGVRLLEMPRSREQGLCCGGGGGGMWLEVHGVRRIQEIRLEEAEALGPTMIASACPFCMSMFDLGAKTLKFDEKGIHLKDIAELAAEAIA